MRNNILRGAAAAAALTLAAAMLTAICLGLAAVAAFFAGDRPVSAAAPAAEVLPVIVIDAGHGGMDSGAVGVDGSLEKELNLAVAEKLAAICRIAGIDCVMTRTEDVMLVPDSVTEHRKMHDLRARLDAVRAVTDGGREAMLVSIHMNKFTDARYSGLQVWHAADDVSRMTAARVQGYARTFLDPANTREIKRTTSAIYILAHAETPAILVECGFLSNAAECQKLETDAYRTQLAMTIFAALMEQFSESA